METVSEIEEKDIKEITAEVATTVTNVLKEVILMNTGNYS